jgi:hypothetical protein
MPDYLYEPGSFRDRNGRVFYADDKTFRSLSNTAYTNWKMLLGTGFFSDKISAGKIIATREADDITGDNDSDDVWAAHLIHQTIPFISYPYEWSFNMLKDAALLHLELLLDALEENMILKDSSAYNIQWTGVNPVFIDIPSFEALPTGEPWVGYRQFCQLFLYPLLLQAYKDIDFHSLLRGNIDGIDPVQMNNLMSLRDMFRPGVLTNIYLQTKLQNQFSNTGKNVKNELKSAGFNKELIKANVKRIRKLVTGLRWSVSESQWSAYTDTHSYTDSDQDRKTAFVENITASSNYNLVWDIGCNTGKFSRIAARHADYVVAMDADHLCIDHFYRALQDEGVKNILPLYMNLADPSPDLGWRGLERKSLTRRGTPDLILCLALIHHAVISANIPVQDFVDWLASLDSEIIIEFVTKEDIMVKTLLRNKEDQYDDYTPEYFEAVLARSFDVRRTEKLGSGTRQLYFATPK